MKCVKALLIFLIQFYGYFLFLNIYCDELDNEYCNQYLVKNNFEYSVKSDKILTLAYRLKVKKK